MITNPELLMVLGVVSQMDQKDQDRIKALKEQLENVIKDEKDLGTIAVVLLAMEMQNE